ncbi:uncharacterized protein LOC108491312, partial [Nannospalax galili]|uniref:uncharacterized protein LOC108491312 n=1 Tax=Nannospalax galili TaxID=1026970 RepID=UPI000819FCEC
MEGTPVSFHVDTGAQHSVLIETLGKLSNKRSWVQGATGMNQYSWTTQRKVDLGTGQVSHSFLIMPDCPYTLLGRDLLTKIGAHIHFSPNGVHLIDKGDHPIQVLTLQLEDEYQLHQKLDPQPMEISVWLQEFPLAWAETRGMRLAAHRPPIWVELKPRAFLAQVKQYPMSHEARSGVTPHIRRLRDQGILIPCRSTWNTPLFPVKKPNSKDYRLVQDLREVNKWVMDIHPTVPNPYTLLSSLLPSRSWYTVLDLKDTFFSLPLDKDSQLFFAFEWQDPEISFNGQLTWTRMPQGFRNAPTLFNEALHEDLGEYRLEHPQLTL